MAATKENLSAVLYGINDIRLEQKPIPVPKDNQVLLKVEVIGICGSDVHYLVNGRCGASIVKKPMVLGHEASGTVVQIGKHVKTLKVGDRVAVEPGVPCRLCHYCKTGMYNLCRDLFFCGASPNDGTLSRYYVHEADFCWKLPDNVDLEEGALMEPLSVGVHACKRAEVKFGDVCLIAGAGPIGLLTLLVAKAMGASKVLIVDILDVKLEMAKQLGADYVLKLEKNMTEEEIVRKVHQLLGQAPNISFDCTGVEACVRMCVASTGLDGVVVLIGLSGKTDMTLPLTNALIKEVVVRGVYRYCNDYPTSIEMVSSGRINIKPLITHHYTLEDVLKAFHTAKTQEGNPIKVVIHANPNWKSS